MKFGAHMSTAGGPGRALQRGKSIQCDSVQLFVKNNMQWAGRSFTTAEVSDFLKHKQEASFSCVFGHTGYLINLGAPPSANRDKSLASLIQEIELAAQLDLPFLVLHPGAHLGTGEEQGLGQVVEGLNGVFQTTRKHKVKIALEITAGQGTCLGHKLEHLAFIIEKARHPERLGICLDTAHLFAAGYPIHTRKGWKETTKKVESLIGLNRLLAFHLNDSKTDLGSRVDRHAHIGQGKIGLEGFCHIIRDARFKSHPACLETPKSADLHEDVENLRILRELAGSA